MKSTNEALGRIHGWMDHSAAAQTWRRCFRVQTTGDYGSVPRRMNVSSSEESSLDPAAELAQRIRESVGVVMAMAYNGFGIVCVAVFILFGIIGCIDISQYPSRLPSCPVPRYRHPFLCYGTQYAYCPLKCLTYHRASVPHEP
ncbi:hypothetical protein ARMSODRAFT_1017598 [Armillaria solidipes]|uniref:Uncharacterized protein n=1 Tax=Armillaria solidipes TaxID=1076256 RepID=A0A2H3BIT7_9AGAR|nr:hypothetical protein ARMSODRAFT_1017598 [Armillaria solidipes]